VEVERARVVIVGGSGIRTIEAANPVRARLEPALSPTAWRDERAAWRRFVLATTGI
jgi:hypothetical protein